MFQARSHTFELKNAGAVELHVGWTIDTEGKEDPFTVLPQAGTLTLTLTPTLALALALTLTPKPNPYPNPYPNPNPSPSPNPNFDPSH